MPDTPAASAATEHCYTPSWCRCPDEPKCQLCKSGRCPVEPPHTAATIRFEILRVCEPGCRDCQIYREGRTRHTVSWPVIVEVPSKDLERVPRWIKEAPRV